MRADEVGALSAARLPQRERGRERFARLLDAAASLLAESGSDEVTLAKIAAEAGIPLPSAYHFFPNRNAVFVELARRFHGELAVLSRARISPAPTRWQDLLLIRQTRKRDYFNTHAAALRLFIGAGAGPEVRKLDLLGNASLAARRAAEFRRRFRCDGLDGLEEWLAISFGLTGGVWAVSHAEHGEITERHLREGWRAACAYLRCYLPEELPPAESAPS